MSNSHNNSALENLGVKGLFFTLAIIFIWFGCMKFTAYEAEAINGLLVNHPITNALVGGMDQYLVSKMIGSVELLIGVLLALRFFAPKLAALGGLMAAATFVLTFSFFFTTPGVFDPYEGASSLAISVMPGQFLLKDLALLGASFFAMANASNA